MVLPALHGEREKWISTDGEFNKKSIQLFLTAHNVEYRARPARHHSNIGIVEQKNGLLKTIMKKLDGNGSLASTEQILARATFPSKMFSGSWLLSSFQLAKGYLPALLSRFLPPKSVVGFIECRGGKDFVRSLTRPPAISCG